MRLLTTKSLWWDEKEQPKIILKFNFAGQPRIIKKLNNDRKERTNKSLIKYMTDYHFIYCTHDLKYKMENVYKEKNNQPNK